MYSIDNFIIFENKVEINGRVLEIDVIYDPFEIRIYSANHLSAIINGKGLMRFEHRQLKPNPPP